MIIKARNIDRYRIVENSSGDWAHLYDGDKLVDQGHVSDLYERIVQELFEIEYDDTIDRV
jgi:hypothetical protein